MKEREMLMEHLTKCYSTFTLSVKSHESHYYCITFTRITTEVWLGIIKLKKVILFRINLVSIDYETLYHHSRRIDYYHISFVLTAGKKNDLWSVEYELKEKNINYWTDTD